MMFYVKKSWRVLRVLPKIFILWSHEKLCERRWYRRFVGGTWYFVYDLETHEEYWTQRDLPVWLAMTIQKENYEV